MPDYIGSKCLICGEILKKTDDIVVCPECGTPYHRECYFKEGKCVNTELHESGGAWKSDDISNENPSQEDIRCARCGESNPSSGIFCKRCGMPLNQQDKAVPFPDAQPSGYRNPFENPNIERITLETELDGVKVKDLGDFVGRNQMYYLPNFIRFSKLRTKFSVNFFAMFLPEIYFSFRKMYFVGFVLLVLKILFFIPVIDIWVRNGILFSSPILERISLDISDEALGTLSSVLNFVSSIISLSCAFFANWFYYQKTVKSIKKVREMEISDEEKTEVLKTKGGVSFAFAACIATALLILGMFLFQYYQN